MTKFPSCSCLRISCECPCLSGHFNKEGEIVKVECFDALCTPHGDNCLIFEKDE
jgi:hypothetical protein